MRDLAWLPSSPPGFVTSKTLPPTSYPAPCTAEQAPQPWQALASACLQLHAEPQAESPTMWLQRHEPNIIHP